MSEIIDPLDPSSYGQPRGEGYRRVLADRARGRLPEMESSKAIARVVAEKFEPGWSLLDVGCGCGHYLPSLLREVGEAFQYVGVDVAEDFLVEAERIFEDHPSIRFERANIFELPFKDSSFDLVMCNNLLLHLPEIRTPLAELVRVARHHVFVRTLIGTKSFRVKDVHPPEEYDDHGEPLRFNFYNIYSEAYIMSLLRPNKKVDNFEIMTDVDFNPTNIERSRDEHTGARDATYMLGGLQANGYLILPWSILQIGLR